MRVGEAKEWVEGRRSNINMMPGPGSGDPSLRYAMVEVADAACVVRAVAVLFAAKYGLTSVDDPDDPQPF